MDNSKKQGSLLSPLGLIQHIKTEKLRFTTAAWVGTGLAVLGLSLLNGRYLFAPGISIDLPSISQQIDSGLPIAQVLSIGQNGMLFFEGQVLNVETLPTAFKKYLGEKKISESVEGNRTLLIKGDKNTTLECFLKVCQLAHECGFNQIQVATLAQDKLNPWMSH